MEGRGKDPPGGGKRGGRRKPAPLPLFLYFFCGGVAAHAWTESLGPAIALFFLATGCSWRGADLRPYS